MFKYQVSIESINKSELIQKHSLSEHSQEENNMLLLCSLLASIECVNKSELIWKHSLLEYSLEENNRHDHEDFPIPTFMQTIISSPSHIKVKAKILQHKDNNIPLQGFNGFQNGIPPPFPPDTESFFFSSSIEISIGRLTTMRNLEILMRD